MRTFMAASGVAATVLAAWLFRADGAAAIAIFIFIFIAVFFGCYPARRASKLDPVETLRFE